MAFDPSILPQGPHRELYNYWVNLKNGDALPHIGTFDLMGIPHIVPGLCMVDVIDKRCTVRFSGAGMVLETGQDVTGMDFDMLPDLEGQTQRVLNCATDGEPYYLAGLPITWTSIKYKIYSTLVLPLQDDNGKITRIVLLMVFK